MFMKTLEFSNEKVERDYKYVVSECPAINSIIDMIGKDSARIEIKEILNDLYNINIKVFNFKEVIDIFLDYLSNRIKVKFESKACTEVYDIIPRMDNKPIAFEYQNEKRKLVNNIIPKFNDEASQTASYQLFEDGNEYLIIIKYPRLPFSEKNFIRNFLEINTNIDNIRTLLIEISKILDLDSYDLVLADSKGSTISMDRGILTKYIEIREQDNEYIRITLDDGNFYVEQRVKEKYDDKEMRLIKKIGGYSGKEKKRSKL